MSKSFEHFQSQAENYTDFQKPQIALEPNLFVDDTPPEELRRRELIGKAMTGLSTAALSLITSPFQVTQIALQLSILSHKNKFADAKEVEGLISKIPQEASAQDRRRYELIIRNGVMGYNKSFRAPVYASYKEAFQSIANQGLFGFYKGNFLGLVHTWANSFLRFRAFQYIESLNYEPLVEGNFFVRGAYETTILTLVDLLTHPLQLMQSRFILQNRLPNFSLYKSFIHFFKKHYSDPKTMFQGWSVHLPKNIIFLIGQYNFLTDRPFEGYLLSNFIAQTLAYPLTTVLRRLHCQDNKPGMLPYKYTGFLNAFKTIAKEEGVKGLFRGFAAFTTVQLFSTLLVLNISLNAGIPEVGF